MKTTTQLTSNGKKNLLQLIIIVMTGISLQAQSNTPFIGVRSAVCGNGLSSTSSITLGYKQEAMEVEIGANFQSHYKHFSGMEAMFSYLLTDSWSRKTHLYAFINSAYNFSGYLSKPTIQRELIGAPEMMNEINNLKLQTFETHVGFSLRRDFGSHFSSLLGIGFGMYHTVNTPDNFQFRFRADNSVSLFLTAGIRYSFKK